MRTMLVTVYAGMPLWVWALVLFLTTANEIINRAKWTRAQSLLQGICLAVLKFPLFGPLLQRAPVLGDTLVRISTPLVVVVPPSAAAAIQASVAAAQRDKEAGKVEVAGMAGLVAIGLASFVAYVMAVTLAGLLVGGCAGSMVNYDKTVGTAAMTAVTGYRALDVVDDQQQAAIRREAEAGHKVEAQHDLDAWQVKWRKGKLALDALSESVQTAANARPIVAAAKDRDRQVTAWIARLLALAGQVEGSLVDLKIINGGAL